MHDRRCIAPSSPSLRPQRRRPSREPSPASTPGSATGPQAPGCTGAGILSAPGGTFPRDTLAAQLEVVHVQLHSRLEIGEGLQDILVVRRGLGEQRLTPDDKGASDGIDRLDLGFEGICGISQHGSGECADQEPGHDGMRKESDGGWTSNDGSRRIAWNAPQRS